MRHHHNNFMMIYSGMENKQSVVANVTFIIDGRCKIDYDIANIFRVLIYVQSIICQKKYTKSTYFRKKEKNLYQSRLQK